MTHFRPRYWTGVGAAAAAVKASKGRKRLLVALTIALAELAATRVATSAGTLAAHP